MASKNVNALTHSNLHNGVCPCMMSFLRERTVRWDATRILLLCMTKIGAAGPHDYPSYKQEAGTNKVIPSPRTCERVLVGSEIYLHIFENHPSHEVTASDEKSVRRFNRSRNTTCRCTRGPARQPFSRLLRADGTNLDVQLSDRCGRMLRCKGLRC